MERGTTWPRRKPRAAKATNTEGSKEARGAIGIEDYRKGLGVPIQDIETLSILFWGRWK
jgi:hypothetical protein